MNGKELASIIFTAIVGFCVGIYLYFSGFLVATEGTRTPTQTTASDFAIVSEAYGGCRDQCPSFQILADGSYRYLFTPAGGGEQIIRDGNIPRSLRRDIANVVTPAALALQSTEIQPSFCNSFTDGIDVTYTITLSGREYELDTCGTDIDTSSRLWDTLVKTWIYFETGDI